MVMTSRTSGGGGGGNVPLSPGGTALPGESDRKATMGCLAAVLNIMFTSRQRDALSSNNLASSTKKAADADTTGLTNSTNNGGTDLNAEDSFDIRSEEYTKAADIRQAKFQKELLTMSAELLLLTPDHATVFMPNLGIQCKDEDQEYSLLLEPFLLSLSSADESFRCIALLLFRFLMSAPEGGGSGDGTLSSRTIIGYDARVRYAFKHLAVTALTYWDMKDHDFMGQASATAHATRKFEALEDSIALRIMRISKSLEEKASNQGGNSAATKSSLAGSNQQKSIGQHVVRGLKIGAAGVAAGTAFAITGGLAAPAIAGGIVALTGVGTVASIAVTLLMIPAATTIFGVAGGSLVASKMSTRTQGLSEFEIQKVPCSSSGADTKDEETCPELSRTVCISGWLRDEHDFQRPFGLTPESLTDKHELLCRFCSVYAPSVVPKCREILEQWKGKEDELWEMLRIYGRDPDSLLPLLSGPRHDAVLSRSENDALDGLIRAMDLPVPVSAREDNTASDGKGNSKTLPPPVSLLTEVLTINSGGVDTSAAEPKESRNDAALRLYKAWDYRAEYGGEQYTIAWEKNLLLQLNRSAKEFQLDLAKSAAGEALKKTAMASLMTAVAIPSAMLSLTNIIDEKWTLVAERANEAGILLAHSLLDSDAGHRPVSLVGFSFGARVVLSCVQELARQHCTWEQQQQQVNEGDSGSRRASTAFRKGISTRMSRSKSQREPAVFRPTREPASIVEDVIVMGTPASVKPSSWAVYRSVVGGRLVNCYSKNDLMLALMYRYKNVTQILNPPVGIGEVTAPGIENYDCSSLVANHGEYCVAVREILELVGYGQPRGAGTRDI